MAKLDFAIPASKLERLVIQHDPAAALAHARMLHRKYPLIDGHNDLPWSFRRGGGNRFEETDLRLHRTGGQTDIPRLREGGVGAQFWSVYVPASLAGDDAYQTTREQILIVYKMARKYPDAFSLARTSKDIESVFYGKRPESEPTPIPSLIGMEGGHSINNSLSNLRELYRLGARYMTLTHSKNTPWADSATDDRVHGGLTAFGVQVVQEMNKIGMLVDLSHVSAETMHDALDVAKAPVIFSHSSARAICGHPRNVPDDVLRRLKKNGGVCMVVILDEYVSQELYLHEQKRAEAERRLGAAAMESWNRENPAPKATLSQVADHIDHIKKVVGVDHIGIGGDYDGGGGVVGLEDVSKYPYLTAELIKRGYTDLEIGKILGLNVLRAMRAAEDTAESLQR